jgi:hypothetical protein
MKMRWILSIHLLTTLVRMQAAGRALVSLPWSRMNKMYVTLNLEIVIEYAEL